MLKHIVAKNHNGENLYKFDEIKQYFLKGAKESWYFEELKEFINNIGKGTDRYKYYNLSDEQKTAIDLGIISMNDLNEVASHIGISDKQIDDIKQFIANKELKAFEEYPYKTMLEYDSSEYFENIKSDPYFYLVRFIYETNFDDDNNSYEIEYDEPELIDGSNLEFHDDYIECEKLLNKKLYYKDIKQLVDNATLIGQGTNIIEGTVKNVNMLFDEYRLPFVLKNFLITDRDGSCLDEYYRLYKLQ